MNLMKQNSAPLFKILIFFCLLVFPFILSTQSQNGNFSTSFLFCLACTVPLFNCYIRQDKLSDYDFFQPGTVFILFYYVYIIFPAYYDWIILGYGSNWVQLDGNVTALFDYALLICIIGVISFGLGYKWFSKRKLYYTPYNSERTYVFRSIKTILIIISIFTFIGLASKYLVLASYGPINILETLSPSKRVEAVKDSGGVSTYISVMQYFFDWSILLFSFYSILSRRLNKLLWIILLIGVFIIYVTVPKRSAVIPLFIFPLIWYHYRVKPIAFNKGVLYSILLFLSSFIFLMFRIIIPLVAEGSTYSLDAVGVILSDPLIFYFESPELSIFDMVLLAIQNGESILSANGGFLALLIQSNITPILYLIPRAIWPDKPVFRELGQIFYTYTIGAPQDTEVGFAISIFSTLYVFGGIFGIILGMFLLGRMMRFLYFFFKPWSSVNVTGLFWYTLVVWNSFQFIRFGSFGFLVLLIIQTQLQGIVLLSLILKKNPESQTI